uniref:Uncharacterized protein n=1 Tax=Setaria italica TaxID=4555 RepID=K4A1L7_SETIT
MDGSGCSAVPRLPDDALVEILSRASTPSPCADPSASPSPAATSSPTASAARISPKPYRGLLYFDGSGIRGGDDDDGNSDGSANGDLVSSRSKNKKVSRPNYGHFINLLGQSVPVPLLDPSLASMKEQLDVEAIRLLDSCNSLLLFGPRWGSDTYDSQGYIVCNPVTEQCVAVPSSGLTPPPPEEGVDEEDCVNDVRTFLLFDPYVSLYFHLVQFWQDGYRENVEGVCTYASESGLWSDRSIAVDGQGKTCKIIYWPNKHLYHNAAFIGQSQGCLHCISGLGKEKAEVGDFQFTGLSIWGVLEDYDAEEWVLKHNVSFLQLFGTKNYVSPFHYVVVAFHPDRNLVFFVDQWEHKLIAYDLDSREVCVLCTLGQVRSCMTLYFPCFESSALGYKH